MESGNTIYQVQDDVNGESLDLCVRFSTLLPYRYLLTKCTVAIGMA